MDFKYCKLEIFLPPSHLEVLQKALQEVDAGHIGNYDSCMSVSPVTGYWRPLDGCNPYIFHSFRDSYEVMKNLFADLSDADVKFDDWEILFELRIKKSRYIRIYADVLVITENYVFSLEFKMNDKILEEEMSQAAKYSPYLEVLFGPQYEVIPVLVLTKAEDLYQYAELAGTTAEIPICSGDMLFNIFDEYLGFLEG